MERRTFVGAGFAGLGSLIFPQKLFAGAQWLKEKTFDSFERNDVIRFCNDICSQMGIKLYPVQKKILHQLYSGKYEQLAAVLGRNSGKDLLISLIALYQVNRLLKVKKIYSHYDIHHQSPIYITIISDTEGAANQLTSKIQQLVVKSSLKNSIDNFAYNKIQFKTDSNPVTLMSCSAKVSEVLGKRNFSVLFNNITDGMRTVMGHTESQNSMGIRVEKNVHSYLYSALAPSTADFIIPGKRDSKGVKLDSKVISISSPTAMMYKLYKNPVEKRLTVRYPTWEVNPELSRDQLKAKFPYMSDKQFNIEFGAEFSDEMRVKAFRI